MGLHLLEYDSDVSKGLAFACVLFRIPNNKITIEIAEVVLRFTVICSETHTVPVSTLRALSKNEKSGNYICQF